MSSERPSRAVIHVGAPKTGSTFLQGVLWRNNNRLASCGTAMLGRDQAAHYRAGKDLRDLAFDPADPGVDWTGAWDGIAAAAGRSTASTVVISDEHLAAVTGEQAQRAAASLAPREVHVVYVVRDLVGLLPSEWQEYVKHGSTLSYPDWARRVLTRRRVAPGRWFWSVHDPVDVVTRWSTAVPLSQIHVIWMPAPTAPSDELWRRFAQAADIDPECVEHLDVKGNPSLGFAATELLRLVNDALPDDFPQWHRTGLVRDVFANEVLNPLDSTRPALLPDDLMEAARRRADDNADGLRALGCDVIGERSHSSVPSSGVGDEAPPDSVAMEIAVDAIVGLIEQMAEMRDRHHESQRTLRSHERQLQSEIDRLAGELVERSTAAPARYARATKTRILEAESRSTAVAWALERYRGLRRRRG